MGTSPPEPGSPSLLSTRSEAAPGPDLLSCAERPSQTQTHAVKPSVGRIDKWELMVLGNSWL